MSAAREEPGRDRAPRQSALLPLLIPLGALALIGAVLWGFSRILLNTTHTAATAVALVAAMAIMAIAAYVASRRQPGNVAVFSMVGGAAGIAMLAGGLALLAAPPHGEEEGGGGPAVTIVAPPNAVERGFEETEYTVPADVAFQMEFDNQDPGVPHNVFIAEEEGGTNLFEGQTVNGPAVVTYSVEEPLAEGEYFFFCSVHPTTMTGTLRAAPGEGEGGEPAGGEGGGEPGGEPGGGGPVIVAEQLAFAPTELELPAETSTTLTFDNRDDAGTFGPHNVAIYEDDSYSSPLFTGELVQGPATASYEVPPLPEGTYPFRCDIHPQMTGTANVTAAAGAGGGGGGPGEEPTASPPDAGGG